MLVIKNTKAVIIMWLSKRTIRPMFALLTIGTVITGANAVRRGRILGGGIATSSEFRGIAKLSVRSGYTISNCGAAIISRRHIVTAAHCIHGKSISSIHVRAGVYDIGDSRHAVDGYATKYFIHPNYVPQSFWSSCKNDIAVLVLGKDLPIGGHIRALNLPTAPPSNRVYYKTAGWGLDSSYASTIQSRLKTLTMTLCPSNTYVTPDKTLCTQGYSGATCAGDSGSPLVSSGYVYGIVSTGQCEYGGITFFTDVYAFRNWIINIVRQTPY